jgi:hypothetical protein
MNAMNKTTRVSTATLGVVALICLVGGCDKAAEETLEGAIEAQIASEGGEADVEFDDDSFSMKVKGKDGNTQLNIGAGTKIPDNFPADVPMYAGLTIVLAHHQAEQEAFVIQGTTADALSKVANHFQQEAKRLGWNEESNTAQGDKLKILTYTREGRNLQVMLSEQDNGTTVNLSTASR